MDAGAKGGAHLDEGTIHAWLDDALDGAQAARVEAHVAACAECAAAVAEARGLVAGASRVVRALDDEADATIPTVPSWGAPRASAEGGSLWRLLHFSPARATIAATLLVALGLTLTLPRREKPVVDTVATAPIAMTSPAPPRDALLDSAVKRNIAAAQPPRALEPDLTPVAPRPPREGYDVATVDTTARTRVAEGIAHTLRARVTSPPRADESRVAVGGITAATEPAVAPPVRREVPAEANAAGGISAMAKSAAAAPAAADRVDSRAAPPGGLAAGPAQCYRIESEREGATWGPVALPMTVALTPSAGDSARGSAQILASAGARADAQATWQRVADGSLQLNLRRIGYRGRISLAEGEDTRKGEMRSGLVTAQLGSVVVTSVGGGSGDSAAPAPAPAPAKRVSTKRSRPVGVTPVRADSAAAPERPSYDAAPAVPVLAHRVACH